MTTDLAIALGNVPAEPNSFVGRERDLAELALLLSDVRALTLCGPGGIGKTRLALRLATELGPGFPDGTWLAELADINQQALVAVQVAAVLGIRAEPDRPLADTLADALKPRRLLLVLDTCEHVVEASALLVQQLLAACPWLRVIVTSREPLRVRGETVWRVPPLDLPASGSDVRGGEETRHEAIRLFTERAAAVRPGFRLGPENRDAVVRLVRTLDGMPLAIELAAARVRALSVEQIADRLDDRFGLLASGDRTAPPRQQTLRAAVDWSYELLTASEQALLRRLSVFSGWNLEMAEQVCADEMIPSDRVLELLAALIDKSLVALDGELAGDARYRLLDTIRQYAKDRLAASAEECAIRQRHRDLMLAMVEQSAAAAFRRGDPPWPVRIATYRRMAAERANFLVALSACADRGDTDAGLRLCSALHIQWIVSGDLTEGVSWFDRFLATDSAVSPAVRAKALMHRAGFAFLQQDQDVARRCAEECLELSRGAGGDCEIGGLRMLALLSLRAGRYGEAMDLVDRAIELARTATDPWDEGLALGIRAAIIARQGDDGAAVQAFESALDVLQDNNGWGVAQILYGLGSLARARGDHAAALHRFDSALALFRQIDARPEISRCLAGIGWVALAQSDLRLARSSLTECLQLSLAAGQRLAIARGLEAFAVLAVAQGDPERAVRLEGAARSLREAVGGLPSATASPLVRRPLDVARTKLGASAAVLLEQGRAMSAYEAARLAVEPPGDPDHAAGGRPTARDARGSTHVADVLTARELQTAALIARGLSNRAIADELVISPATAARHVANILTKLGFSSRVQVAAWMVERESPTTPR
jgi:predicted ATPase/DNA-binding CsgD family transcriptional regulator